MNSSLAIGAAVLALSVGLVAFAEFLRAKRFANSEKQSRTEFEAIAEIVRARHARGTPDPELEMFLEVEKKARESKPAQLLVRREHATGPVRRPPELWRIPPRPAVFAAGAGMVSILAVGLGVALGMSLNDGARVIGPLCGALALALVGLALLAVSFEDRRRLVYDIHTYGRELSHPAVTRPSVASIGDDLTLRDLEVVLRRMGAFAEADDLRKLGSARTPQAWR